MLDKLIELIQAGGFVMPPLIIGSALLWYGLVYRIIVLRRGSDLSVPKLMNNEIGKQDETAFITFLKRIRNKEDGDVVMSLAYDEFSKFNTLTTTVVLISPLLGLLGTVSGMIETFDSLGDMSLFTQSGGIAGGISQALVSTQMGLAVAIPGLVLGKMLSRKQTSHMVDLAHASELIKNDNKVVANA